MLLFSLIIGVMLTILPHNYHFILLRYRKPPKIPHHKKADYLEYINSSKWRKIRRKRLEKDDFKCQNHFVRIVKKNLHVHHLNYRRLGNERMQDLITLCEHCHNKIHKGKH